VDVQQKQTIVTLFLARFTLSEAETAALTSRDVPVGGRFFTNAMDKVVRVCADCIPYATEHHSNAGRPATYTRLGRCTDNGHEGEMEGGIWINDAATRKVRASCRWYRLLQCTYFEFRLFAICSGEHYVLVHLYIL
jgi:hypothetical protein